MAWLYVPELAGSKPELTEQFGEACAQSLTWNGKPSPSRTWLGRWKREEWLRPLSGTISQPSTAARGVAEYLSSLQDIHANRFLRRASGGGWKTTGGFGMTCDGSSTRFDPSRVSSRTRRNMLNTASTSLFATWSHWASAWRRACSELRTSGSPTSGSGCSFWPTPTASRYGNCRGGAAGRVGPVRQSLDTIGAMWPTPTSRDAAASGAAGYSTASGRHSGVTLSDAAVKYRTGTYDRKTGPKTFLNPAFVEMLMGFAPGLTDYEPLETP